MKLNKKVAFVVVLILTFILAWWLRGVANKKCWESAFRSAFEKSGTPTSCKIAKFL